jgi:hypothetical protein
MDLMLAALIGYLVALLVMRWHKRARERALQYGENIIRQDQENGRRLNELFDQLFDGGPIDLEVQPDRLCLTYQSSRCPGPHGLEYPAEALEAREHLARYLAERIVAARFSRLRIHW